MASVFYTAANWLCWALSAAVHVLDGSAFAKSGWENTGSWAPVQDEVHKCELEVLEGEVPSDLSGAYVRTGPNPHFKPMGRLHLFDGDGMAHVVRFKDGKAAYANHAVRTAKLAAEMRAGWPILPKFGDFRGVPALAYMALKALAVKLRLVNPTNGLGTANTAIAFHANRVLALHEGDLPYALRLACDGLVSTLARVQLSTALDGKKAAFKTFTAHPKRDPETGELLFFSYSVEAPPYCWYGKMDAEGRVVQEMPVPLKAPVMMHDCAITENFMLFIDAPLEFEPKVMIKEKTLPFVFRDRPLRVGVLSRTATSAAEMRWFSLERAMCFHTANAWEEGDKIRLFLCTFKDFSLDEFTATEGSEPVLTEITLDLKTGEASMRRLDESPAAYGDFPVVDPSRLGRPTRFVYVANMQPHERGIPQFVGITKFDLQAPPGKAIAGRALHGGNLLGGEAVFVPKSLASGAREDEGYLMTFATDEQTLESQLLVYDAATMSSTPVARIRMPQRVPHGFHGLWVGEEQLRAQSLPSLLV